MATPSLRQPLLDDALACQNAGDLKGAEAGFRALLKQDPDHADALMLLGALLQKTGRAPAAVPLMERAIKSARDRGGAPDRSWALALVFARRDAGDVDGALADIDGLLSPSQGHPELLSIKADLLQRIGRHGDVVETLNSLLGRNPRNARAWNSLGVSLRALRRIPAAFQAFHKAVEIEQGYAQAARNAGQILKNAVNPEQAGALLNRAIESAGGNLSAMVALIDVLSMAGMTREAEVLARRALERYPGNPDIAVQLGHICMASGDADEAAVLGRSALAARPGLPGALALLAETAEGDEAAETLAAIESLGGGRDQPLPVKASLSFSAGRLCERLKRHGEAFDYFADGNGARRDFLASMGQRYRRDRMEAEVAELIEAFPASAFSGSGGSVSDLPVFIVGMPRSGTTLTEQILASHPRAAGAGELDEVGNIVRWLRREHVYPNQLPSGRLSGIASGYLKQLRRAGPQAVRISDKMPGNFLHLGLIALLFPNSRIVHCRRDPMDTCLSCFTQNFRSEGLAWSCDLDDLGHYYCQYRRLMDHWSSVLPASRILDFDYESTVSALEEQARRLIDFVGLEWDDACLRFSDTDRVVLTASRNQVRKGIYADSVDRSGRYGDRVRPLAESLARCGQGRRSIE